MMERCQVSYTPSFVSFLRSLLPYTHKDTLLAVTKRRTMLFIIFYFFLTILVSLNNEATAFTTAPQQQQQQHSSLLPTASSFPRWSGTASSYSSPPFNQHQQQRSTTTQLRNFFDAVGDLLQGGKLEAETKLPHEPFCGELSCSGEVRTFAVRERP